MTEYLKRYSTYFLLLFIVGCAATTETKVDTFDGKKRITMSPGKVYKESIWASPESLIWANIEWSENNSETILFSVQTIGSIPSSVKININGEITELKSSAQSSITDTNLMGRAAGQKTFTINQKEFLRIINSEKSTIRVVTTSNEFVDGILSKDEPESFIRGAKKVAKKLNW
ncbi:hypothetical protein H5119_16660 [Pseudoalteromonas sp. SG45-5]|nr:MULTISPECIES: hypothetical protein [Pseudoalteromonas]MBB1387146.1 hypothetical protein [Pseudoalteromonas sp. SG45-5]MBB1395422.1 hypothetical protein [Pseudoalteromonas sp. SG44-4]MBB1447517.1 hypothetical protein [Pseudoalteromonas sp. SG41-6]